MNHFNWLEKFSSGFDSQSPTVLSFFSVSTNNQRKLADHHAISWNAMSYLCRGSFEVEFEVSDIICLLFLYRQGQREETIGVKGHAHFATIGTN